MEENIKSAKIAIIGGRGNSLKTLADMIKDGYEPDEKELVNQLVNDSIINGIKEIDVNMFKKSIQSRLDIDGLSDYGLLFEYNKLNFEERRKLLNEFTIKKQDPDGKFLSSAVLQFAEYLNNEKNKAFREQSSYNKVGYFEDWDRNINGKKKKRKFHT